MHFNASVKCSPVNVRIRPQLRILAITSKGTSAAHRFVEAENSSLSLFQPAPSNRKCIVGTRGENEIAKLGPITTPTGVPVTCMLALRR